MIAGRFLLFLSMLPFVLIVLFSALSAPFAFSVGQQLSTSQTAVFLDALIFSVQVIFP